LRFSKIFLKKTGGEYHTSLESDTLQNIYRSIGDVVKGLGSVSVQKGKISKGETINGSLPVDSSIMSFNLVLTWPGSDLDLVLYYPDGNKVICNQSSPSGTDDPDISYIAQDTYEIYKVQGPQQGTWKYDVIGVEVTGQEEDYTLALSAATTIKLGAHTDKLDYDMGEGVRITANFTKDGDRMHRLLQTSRYLTCRRTPWCYLTVAAVCMRGPSTLHNPVTTQSSSKLKEERTLSVRERSNLM